MHNTVVEFLYHNWYTRRRVFSAAMLVWIFTSYHIHYTEQAKKPVASATAVTGSDLLQIFGIFLGQCSLPAKTSVFF